MFQPKYKKIQRWQVYFFILTMSANISTLPRPDNIGCRDVACQCYLSVSGYWWPKFSQIKRRQLAVLVGSQESRAVLRWTILKTRCLSSHTSQSRGSEPILLSGGAFQCERQLIKDMNFWGWTEMWCSEEGLGSMFRSCNSCSCTGPLGWAAPLMLYTTYNTICNNIMYIIMIIYDIKLRMILFSDQPSLSD